MAFGKLLKVQPLPDPATVDPSQVVTVDPFAPAAVPQGSASFLQPINVPAPKSWKPSALGVLDRVLGGMTFTEANQDAQADHQAELLRPQLMEMQKAKMALQALQLAGAKNLSFDELTAFLNNPTELGKAYASRQEAATVPAGASRVFGNPDKGGSSFFAPLVKDDGGYAFSMTPDGTKIVGATPYVPKMEKLGPGDVAKAPPVFVGGKMVSQPDQPAQDGSGVPGGATAAPTGPIYGQIADIAAKAGADAGESTFLRRLAQVESSGDPAARNGSSTGLYQFHPDTFAAAGGTNINDVADQTRVALQTSRQYRKALQDIGVSPDDANTYIMHQQGPGGARALFTAPQNVNAIAALTPVYKGDADKARAAILGNGGTADMTAGQFIQHWRDKWGGGQAPAVTSGNAGDAPGTLYGGPAKADDDVPLTSDAIDLLAGKFLSTGVLPPMGMGKAATANRNAVMNRVSGIAKDLGLSADDLVAGNASIKALGQSLNKITAQRYAVAQLEETAKKNADLMLSLAPAGAGQTGMPILNRWLQYGRKQVAGDADVTKFDNALSAFSEEYAKVMSGSLGNQAATDSARNDAKDRLGKYATQGQLQGGIEVMKTEMANRMQALAEVEGGIRARIRSGGRDDGAQPGSDAGSPGEAAPGMVKDGLGRMIPKPMHDAIQAYRGSKAKAGDAANPFTILDDAGYARLPSGAHFIGPDGMKRVKP